MKEFYTGYNVWIENFFLGVGINAFHINCAIKRTNGGWDYQASQRKIYQKWRHFSFIKHWCLSVSIRNSAWWRAQCVRWWCMPASFYLDTCKWRRLRWFFGIWDEQIYWRKCNTKPSNRNKIGNSSVSKYKEWGVSNGSTCCKTSNKEWE